MKRNRPKRGLARWLEQKRLRPLRLIVMRGRAILLVEDAEDAADSKRRRPPNLK